MCYLREFNHLQAVFLRFTVISARYGTFFFLWMLMVRSCLFTFVTNTFVCILTESWFCAVIVVMIK